MLVRRIRLCVSSISYAYGIGKAKMLAFTPVVLPAGEAGAI